MKRAAQVIAYFGVPMLFGAALMGIIFAFTEIDPFKHAILTISGAFIALMTMIAVGE